MSNYGENTFMHVRHLMTFIFSKKAKNSSIQHHFGVQFKITSLKDALKKGFEATTNDGLFSDWLINGVDCSNLDQSGLIVTREQ